MLIAFLTNDLLFTSRVAGVAAQVGAGLETAQSIDRLLTHIESSSQSPIFVLLDLNSTGVEPAAIVPRLKSLPTAPRAIIAFGPHVHEAKLADARAAGCDLVLTRGQFDAQMRSLLMSFVEQPWESPRSGSGGPRGR